MNTTLIGNLISLRYKLMWAKTRSRNGRIALFFAGYLLLVMGFALLVSGGFGAAMIAVRSGKAEMVARVVLTALFAQALLGSVVLGFGMNAIFSDVELRRYPVDARERFLARHLIGIVDPFWFLILALEIGLAVGLYVFGSRSFFAGIAAVLVLFVVNYVAARLIAVLVERLMQRKSGNLVLMLMIMSLALLPSLAAPLVQKFPGFGPAALKVLGGTPPFAAAAFMTGSPDALRALGLLLFWLAALLLLLVYAERIPTAVRATESRKLTWESPYERLGALFGPEHAPFVAHWLRFYVRNTRFRMLYLMSLPLAGFITFNMTRKGGPDAVFVAALGTFPIATFFAVSRMAVNQYGYVGGAFRRLLLLPTPPGASLRTGSYASLLLATSLLPLAAIAWVALAPAPFDARKLIMLLLSGLAGAVLFHAAALWVGLLNPRRGNYGNNFGNDLSLGGNILLIGGVLLCIAVPQLLSKFVPALVSPANWWLAILAAAIAVAVYSASLRAAGPVFRNRRERLLAVVEGRD